MFDDRYAARAEMLVDQQLVERLDLNREMIDITALTRGARTALAP